MTKTYHACIGAYVRAYCSIEFQAESDEKALEAAITTVKEQQDDLDFGDYDWHNLALPSVVSLSVEDGDQEIVEGYDFALTAEDAREFAAWDLLTAAKNALADLEGIMPEHEPSGDRKHAGWKTIEELRAAIIKAETFQS